MIILIQDATSVGESEKISIIPGSDTGQVEHSFQVVSTGSPTALTFSIVGSIDGVNFSQLLQHSFTADEITAGSAIVHLVNKAMPQIKASIDVLTGGVAPTVSAYYFKGPRSV